MDRILVCFLLITLTSGCREEFVEIHFEKENSTDFNEQFFLVEKGRFEIDLDNKTGFAHRSMQINSTSNGEYFSFINEKTNTIYIHEVETSKLAYKVKLEHQGPNSVGNLQVASHTIINLDSIVVYNINTGGLYLTNTKSEIYWKENLLDYSGDSFGVNPEPAIFSPIVKINDDLFIACSIGRYLTDYSKTYSVLKFNLRSRNREYLYALPQVYNSGYWGTVFKYMPSFDFNPITRHIVLNYPIDPELHVMSLDGKEINRHYESSKYIESMKPLRTNISYGIKKDHGVLDTEQTEYSFSTSDFLRIIYDPYRNVYYRIAYIRPSIESLRTGNRNIDFSISILDANFIKKGERKFNGQIYKSSMVLLSSEGLNIARKDLYDSNEDLLSYTIFKLDKTKPE